MGKAFDWVGRFVSAFLSREEAEEMLGEKWTAKFCNYAKSWSKMTTRAMIEKKSFIKFAPGDVNHILHLYCSPLPTPGDVDIKLFSFVTGAKCPVL
jgi:hypothetical protein